MLKVNNETKVGILTVLAVVLLVLGFNILKGRSLFSTKKTIYAVYTQVNGLQASNVVMVNGLGIGTVQSLSVMDKRAGRILVTLQINKDIEIPKNSVARISADLLGTRKVEIDFGNTDEFLKNKDTIYAATDGSITDALKEQLSPLVKKLETTLGAVDTLLLTVNSVFDTATKHNLRQAVAGLNGTLNNLNNATRSINGMLAEGGKISGTFDNFSAVSANLKNNNEKISNILTNFDKASGSLANGQIDSTLTSLHSTMARLNEVAGKISSPDGSLGLLMNDKKVYNNLQGSLGSLNKLLEDLRYNPWRYVHLSVFGRKNKVVPIPSDTATAQ
ncbi:MlaD family protein [Chitinophaga deserti]|uniref:MlaD family protein n=1 Tax=Chitinophaga deserti TaxID=2164099 RepID=UPI000D6C40F1|nr:MlaD family protein [Chitinophaga deserti]